MVAPQQLPPIQPTTKETASTADALLSITAGSTSSPAISTPTTPTAYKEYEDEFIFVMMRLAAMRPAHQ